MLPESLSDVYQLYKRDTNAIATWLANTAKNNGYGATLDHPDNVSHGSGRLKGKARKKAKEATETARTIGELDMTTDEQMTSSINKAAHVLAIKAFVPLATFIAAARPVIQVPLFLSITLDRVIKVRATFSRILGERLEQVDETSDAGHNHFLGVLEKVRDILKPNMQLDAPDLSSLDHDLKEAPAMSSDAVIGEGSTSNNPFDILSLYESTEDSAHPFHAAQPPEPNEEYEVKLKDNMSDAFIAFVVLMRVCQDLRDTVGWLWHSYKIGTVFLDTTTISANAAIGFVREKEEQLTPLIERHGGLLSFVDLLSRGISKLLKEDPGFRELSADDIKFRAYVAEPYMQMCHVYRMLDEYRKSSSLSTVKAYDGSHGWYDEAMDLEDATDRQTYHQNYSALLEVLPDISILSMASGKEFVKDEFTHGVRTMHKTERVPLWLCFAAQTYLDTLRSLHGHLDLPWNELLTTSERIKSSLASAIEFPGDIHLVDDWPAVKGLVDQMIQKSSGWGLDPTFRYKTKRGLPVKPNQFLRRHPLYCGLWAHNMRAQFHEVGVKFASAFGYVHQSYQLYHALKQEELLGPDQRWQDMETLLMLQCRETFFANQDPTTPQGYLQNLSLKSGFAVTKSASKKFRKKKTERGRLKEKCEFSMQLMDLYRQTALRGVTICDVQQMIAATGSRFVITKEGERRIDVGGKTYPTEKDAPDKMPLRELVIGLSNVVLSEAHQMALDYFQLHKVCLEVLEQIRGMIDVQTVQRLAPESAVQKHLPAVVTMVFRDAAGDEPQGLLQLSASTLSSYIERMPYGHCIWAMRDLGVRPCRCAENIGKGIAASSTCRNPNCGGRSPPEA